MFSKCFYIDIKLNKSTLRKVSTSKLAKEFLGVSTDELWKALIDQGFLTEGRELTEKSPPRRKGSYILKSINNDYHL